MLAEEGEIDLMNRKLFLPPPRAIVCSSNHSIWSRPVHIYLPVRFSLAQQDYGMAACGLFDTSAGLSVDKLRPPRNPRSPINTSQRHEQGNKISPALHFKWDESIALRRRTHPVDNTESERRIGCVDTNNIYTYTFLYVDRESISLKSRCLSPWPIYIPIV